MIKERQLLLALDEKGEITLMDGSSITVSALAAQVLRHREQIHELETRLTAALAAAEMSLSMAERSLETAEHVNEVNRFLREKRS